MSFCFYPRHEHNCPNVGHCPHLGGAALGALVSLANETQESREYLFRTIDSERETVSRLLAENERLQKELDQVKLALKLERQNKFTTNKQKREDQAATEPASGDSQPQKKRGAPVGHPGWYRKTPTQYDWAVDVLPPIHCPHCRGRVVVDDTFAPSEHMQEDVIDGQYRVVLYRHPAACCGGCGGCGEWLQQAGEGELLGSRIGPQLRSKALYLRHVIGMSYRKIPEAIEELLGITFTPGALIGFEKFLNHLATPIVEDIAKKLASSEGAIHADETYSTLDGQRAYFWVHATTRYVHFSFGTSRSGKVSRDVLGNNFTGTLVTDCFSGDFAQTAAAKQKCLSHLARTARDWQKLTIADSPDFAFFDAVKQFVKRGCEFHRLRGKGLLDAAQIVAEMKWLRDEQSRLQTWVLSHDKAKTLQARIVTFRREWLVFVDDLRVPPTNNLAEQALRPLVVLRKITFGHRCRKGGQRMAALMSVAETARRHGHRASRIFLALMSNPPSKVLRLLYAVV